MKFLLTVYVFLLMVCSSVCEDITVRGTEGGQVTIKCAYANGYENSYKYFYKGIYKDSNIILNSYGGESSVFEGRFSLRDDHQMSTFTVTIRNLRMADAGPYGCRAGWGEYKQIQLNVVRAPQKTRPVQISTSTIRPYTNTSTDHTGTVTPQTQSETTKSMTGNTAAQLDQPNADLAFVAGGLGSVLLVLVLCSGMFLISVACCVTLEIHPAVTSHAPSRAFVLPCSISAACTIPLRRYFSPTEKYEICVIADCSKLLSDQTNTQPRISFFFLSKQQTVLISSPRTSTHSCPGCLNHKPFPRK